YLTALDPFLTFIKEGKYSEHTLHLCKKMLHNFFLIMPTNSKDPFREKFASYYIGFGLLCLFRSYLEDDDSIFEEQIKEVYDYIEPSIKNCKWHEVGIDSTYFLFMGKFNAI